MRIINRLAKDHTSLAIFLGLCPALALSNKVETAYLFVICVLVLLITSYFIIFSVGKIFKGKVKFVFDILVVAGLVTVMEFFLKSYFPTIYNAFGIYLALLSVNIIILERFIWIESKVKRNMFDILKLGVCFGLTVLVVAFIRELFGTGIITLMDLSSGVTGYKAIFHVFSGNGLLPIHIFNEPAFAFLIFAFVIALFRYLREEKKNESR